MPDGQLYCSYGAIVSTDKVRKLLMCRKKSTINLSRVVYGKANVNRSIMAEILNAIAGLRSPSMVSRVLREMKDRIYQSTTRKVQVCGSTSTHTVGMVTKSMASRPQPTQVSSAIQTCVPEEIELTALPVTGDCRNWSMRAVNMAYHPICYVDRDMSCYQYLIAHLRGFYMDRPDAAATDYIEALLNTLASYTHFRPSELVKTRYFRRYLRGKLPKLEVVPFLLYAIMREDASQLDKLFGTGSHTVYDLNEMVARYIHDFEVSGVHHMVLNGTEFDAGAERIVRNEFNKCACRWRRLIVQGVNLDTLSTTYNIFYNVATKRHRLPSIDRYKIPIVEQEYSAMRNHYDSLEESDSNNRSSCCRMHNYGNAATPTGNHL